MQVTETAANGLKRELKVVIGKDEIEKRFISRVENFKGQVQLKGFRKGGRVKRTGLYKVHAGERVVRAISSGAISSSIRFTNGTAAISAIE